MKRNDPSRCHGSGADARVKKGVVICPDCGRSLKPQRNPSAPQQYVYIPYHKPPEKKKPFEAHLEECAKKPDPKKAFRGGLVGAIMENHPDADPDEIQDYLDWMGA